MRALTPVLAAACLAVAGFVARPVMAQNAATFSQIGDNARFCVNKSSGATRLYSPKFAANGGMGRLAKPCTDNEASLPYNPIFQYQPRLPARYSGANWPAGSQGTCCESPGS